MKLFTTASVLFGIAVWYLSGDELGFAVGAGCFWCGAIFADLSGVLKPIKR